MSLLRAFIAIELPAPTREAIRRETAALKGALGKDLVRWVPPENLHLTLKFLGEIPPVHVEFVGQMLAREAAAFAPFEMQVAGLGAFPNAKRPRVIWVGLGAPAPLGSLQRAVEAGVRRLGYEDEGRPFSPHLTLGRVRQNLPAAGLEGIRRALESAQLGAIPAARVEAVHLFESALEPGGSVYTKLSTASLMPPGRGGAKPIHRGDP